VTGFSLRLTEDRFAPSAESSEALSAQSRVLYIASSQLTVWQGAAATSVEANKAWFCVGEYTARAGHEGARVLRYHLMEGSVSFDSSLPFGSSVEGGALLEHPLEFDPGAKYLVRCDRVDFDPGAEALPHRHLGGGIRCLLVGQLDVKVADGPFRTMRPGDAWFESGKEPVHAVASREEAIQLHSSQRPAPGDPGEELHHIRESGRCNPQQASSLHCFRRRSHRDRLETWLKVAAILNLGRLHASCVTPV
jgi:hypothetical protein